MKLTVLTENTTCHEDLTAEHGLSLYIEAGDHRILFDMGQSDVFVRNAEAMGIDLSLVDLAVLSHGHYDHGGGLQAFLRINAKAAVYLQGDAFGAHYNGKEKYIGLDPSLQDHPRLIPVRGKLQLSPGLLLQDCNDLGWCNDSYGLMRKTEDGLGPDEFIHEHYLQITEGQKRIVVSGCSHKGICNIVRYFQPDVLIGGFHLNKLEDPDTLQRIAATLLQYGGSYYTGHCTGQRQYALLKDIMGSRLHILTTGKTINL